MMNILEEYPWLCLLPPVSCIMLAIWSKRILSSLFIGVVLGGCIKVSSLYPWKFVPYIFKCFRKGFISDDWDIDRSHLGLLAFLAVLGVLVCALKQSGYQKTFSDYLAARLRSQRQAEGWLFGLGGILFIDDYFKILAIGNIGKPICDRMRISRVRLAYFLDAMAAPMCILVPISSWGANVITQMQDIMDHHTYISKGYDSGTSLFCHVALWNLYPLFTLLLLLLCIFFSFNFSAMQKEEEEARRQPSIAPPKEVSGFGAIRFIAPILIMTLVTFLIMGVHGVYLLNQENKAITLLGVIEHADTNMAMLIAGVLACGVCWCLKKRPIPLGSTIVEGVKTMRGSIYILIFAWAFARVIEDMRTGEYMGSLFQTGHLSGYYLPLCFFLVACFTSFATGSSWATFAILMPIAASMTSAPSLLVPLLGACLGGAVFGDHASPISDTSLLSSTSAGCNHMQHIITQLPYTLLGGVATLAAYLFFGLTQSFWIATFIGIAFLFSMFGFFYWRLRPTPSFPRQDA